MIKSIDNIELKKDLAYNLISDFEIAGAGAQGVFRRAD